MSPRGPFIQDFASPKNISVCVCVTNWYMKNKNHEWIFSFVPKCRADWSRDVVKVTPTAVCGCSLPSWRLHFAADGHMITCDRGHEGSSGVTSSIPTSCRSNHLFIFLTAKLWSGRVKARKWKWEERLVKVQLDRDLLYFLHLIRFYVSFLRALKPDVLSRS